MKRQTQTFGPYHVDDVKDPIILQDFKRNIQSFLCTEVEDLRYEGVKPADDPHTRNLVYSFTKQLRIV